MRKTVLYLRSSKDRSDVSIDAQRKDLMQVAQERDLLIVNEFADVVESAKSEYRPAFQQLIVELGRPGRVWSVILMIDHSRLSRQPYVGHGFRYECAKRGVEVIFGMFPELDPVTQIFLDNGMDAVAVSHSLISKQKGLAGMAMNVSRGWRAGGRAPRGYRLTHVPTGAVREGAPVMKSLLELGPDAALVARYLKARAAGAPRVRAVRDLAITWPGSSLVAIEWNALTYAGHTVWNRHNETRPEGGYLNAKKMRSRSEWHIKRDTHPALITDTEAEVLLTALEGSRMGKAVSDARRSISPHLLSGVLMAPDGRRWEGWRDRYRVKGGNGLCGRYVHKASVDEAVVGQIQADFGSEGFVEALVREARQAGSVRQIAPAKGLQAEVVALNAQIAKAMDLAIALDDPAPALRKVNELEARRVRLVDEITRLEQEQALQAALSQITPDHVRGLVHSLADELAQAEHPRLKAILTSAVERVMLDPATLDCRIHYRIPLERTLSMASPRECAGWGILRAESVVLGLMGKMA